MHRRFLTACAVTAAVLCPAPRIASTLPYDYYVIGNPADVKATTRFGIALVGGGKDVDAVFEWMSERAGGGDFVVIRASGDDAYNDYVDHLGQFDSVETLVLKNRAASSDPFVLAKIRGADALFIAGGDQSNYVEYWKETPVANAIQELAKRGVPIGATSAGTAVLGETANAALRGSTRSRQALADPYSAEVSLDHNFLRLPFMDEVMTDQHFVERDRMGRTLAFMARTVAEGWRERSWAIAIDRETAVLIDDTGKARVVANAGHRTPYAYFLRGGKPQVVAPRTPLTYRGIGVDRAAPGSEFDIPTWRGSYVTSYELDVDDGVIKSTQENGAPY